MLDQKPVDTYVIVCYRLITHWFDESLKQKKIYDDTPDVPDNVSFRTSCYQRYVDYERRANELRSVITSAVDFAPANKFFDWPNNLPREDLTRLVLGYARERLVIENVLASAFPSEFPLGDGEYVPTDQRVTGEHTTTTLADRAVEEITRLRRELDG